MDIGQPRTTRGVKSVYAYCGCEIKKKDCPTGCDFRIRAFLRGQHENGTIDIGITEAGDHGEQNSERLRRQKRRKLAEEMAASTDAPIHARREFLHAHAEQADILPDAKYISRKRHEARKETLHGRLGQSPTEMRQLVAQRQFSEGCDDCTVFCGQLHEIVVSADQTMVPFTTRFLISSFKQLADSFSRVALVMDFTHDISKEFFLAGLPQLAGLPVECRTRKTISDHCSAGFHSRRSGAPRGLPPDGRFCSAHSEAAPRL